MNLLAPLTALLEERHVSRAADRIGISQPAMSRALARLRQALGDELLVRAAGRYELTPRAERIQRELIQLIPRLESLIVDDAFDPRIAEQAFRVAATDYIVLVLGPPLLRRLFQEAPRTNLRVEPWQHTSLDDLHRGTLDLAVTGGATAPPLHSEHLFEDRFVCMLSREHPLAARSRLTLEDYLTCSHVAVGILNGRQGSVDQRLDALGTPRRTSVTVPYHSAAAAAVPGTELVATLPCLLAGQILPTGAVLLSPPTELERMRFSMTWHQRVDSDPSHRWLRETVRAVAAASFPSRRGGARQVP